MCEKGKRIRHEDLSGTSKCRDLHTGTTRKWVLTGTGEKVVTCGRVGSSESSRGDETLSDGS